MSRLEVDVGIRNSPFKNGLDEMRSQAGAWAGSIKQTIGGAFALGGMVSWFNSFREHLGRVKDLADRFGQSTDVVQRVGNVAQLSGSNLEYLSTTLTKLTLEAAKGAESFAELGINASEFAAADYQQQVLMLAQSWEEANGNTDKQAQLMQLLGSKGQDLLPMLAKGVSQLKEEFASAAVVSDQTIDAMTRVNDLIDGLGQKAYVWADKAVQSITTLGASMVAVYRMFSQGGSFSGNLQRIFEETARNDPAKPNTKGSVVTDAERKKAAEEAKKTADAIKALDAEMLDLARSRMTEEQRIADYKREQAEWAAKANDKAAGDTDRADAARKVLELQQQIEDGEKRIAKTKEDEAAADADKKKREDEAAADAEKRLADEQQRQQLDKLDPKARIEALKRQQKALMDAAANDPDRKSAAETKLEALKLNGEIDSAQKELDDLLKARSDKPGVVSSSLAAVGGGGGAYVSSFDPALTEARRQTSLLQQIARNTSGTGASTPATSPF